MRKVFAVVITVCLLTVLVAWVHGNGNNQIIESEVYIVKEGDTLWNIAIDRWNGDIREGVYWIREQNGLESPIIHPGQKLIVPKGDND